MQNKSGKTTVFLQDATLRDVKEVLLSAVLFFSCLSGVFIIYCGSVSIIYTRDRRVKKEMVEKKIRFASSGQLMSFCNTCQKMKSDIDVTDMSNRNFRIDGKSLLGLMSIKLGLPMRLIVSGEDEDLAHQYFTNFEME